MLNIVIIDRNINYAVNIMNEINNNYIKIIKILSDKKEAIKVLNSLDNIDIVLMEYNFKKEIFRKIKNKENYEKAFIIIANEEISNIKDNMIYSIIYKNNFKEIDKIKELLNHKIMLQENLSIREKIIKELNYLGYNFSYKGTQYLIEVIEHKANNPNQQNLEKNIYPIISQNYNNTIHNIKCDINRANNMMYYECDASKLQDYFSLNKDTKPKIKTVVNTIIDKIS